VKQIARVAHGVRGAVYASPMKARLRSRSRHGRALTLLVASGCVSTGVGAGGCAESTALGQGTFSYACPPPDQAHPSVPSPDAACAPGNVASSGALPEVAVGAPFSLQFASSTTSAPQPAVPSLAQATPQGWSLAQPGWLGFIEWSGADVVDFTHVRAEAIASIRLEPDLTRAPLEVGVGAILAATPLDADGAVLGGAISCTFDTSEASVLSVRDLSGRVVEVTARAVGDATITASCVGAQGQVAVQVTASAPRSSADTGAGADASDEAGGGG
jgi:hypothetical protein